MTKARKVVRLMTSGALVASSPTDDKELEFRRRMRTGYRQEGDQEDGRRWRSMVVMVEEVIKDDGG